LKRLLLDQGLPRSTVGWLTEKGWDVVHVGDIGMSAALDTEIIEQAKKDQRVCVTLDADFHALLATTSATGPSTLRIRIEGLDGKALATLLMSIWPRIEHILAKGAMVTVTERAIRIRTLPVTIGAPLEKQE